MSFEEWTLVEWGLTLVILVLIFSVATHILTIVTMNKSRNREERERRSKASICHSFLDEDWPCRLEVTIKDTAITFQASCSVRSMRIEPIAISPRLEISRYEGEHGTLSYTVWGTMNYFAILRVKGKQTHTFLVRVRVVRFPESVWFDVQESPCGGQPEFDLGSCSMTMDEEICTFSCGFEGFARVPLTDKGCDELDDLLSLGRPAVAIAVKRFKDHELKEAWDSLKNAGEVIVSVQGELRSFCYSHRSAPRVAAAIVTSYMHGKRDLAVKASKYLALNQEAMAREILGMPPASKPKASVTNATTTEADAAAPTSEPNHQP